MPSKQLTPSEALPLFSRTEEGKAALGRVSPGEIGYGAAGALLGGGAGWLLSKLLHRSPSKKLKLLYALMGAAAGAGGTEYALSKMDAGDGVEGSMKDRLRLEPAFREALTKDTVQKGSGDLKKAPSEILSSSRLLRSLTTEGKWSGLGTAGLTGALYAKGLGFDWSGLKEAGRLIQNEGLKHSVGQDAANFVQGGWRNSNVLRGTVSHQTKGTNLLNRIAQRNAGQVFAEIGPGGTSYKLDPGALEGSLARIKDIGGNVLLPAGVATLAGTGLGYLIRTLNQDLPEYHRLLDRKTYR